MGHVSQTDIQFHHLELGLQFSFDSLAIMMDSDQQW